MVYGKGINDMPWGWASENEWNNKIYHEWKRMIQRCYDKNFHKTKNGKTYVGCVVCDRWLTLSNFVADIDKIKGFDKKRILNGELHLDKDKKNGTKNKIYSLEFCTWLSKAENQGLAMKGKHHTEESKQKMSENNAKPWKGKFGSENSSSKRVAQIDKTTNELIKIWDSMMDVQRELGINSSNVCACCKGKLKSAGGFVWRYLEDE